MNLWAKSLRQLLVLAVALFFFLSCEDENSIIGYRNPNKKFNVRYIEIPLTSTVVLLDSLLTDNGNQAGSVSILAGSYSDPVMGPVSTQPFIPIYPSGSIKLDPTAEFDSATIQFRLNLYSYGIAGEDSLKFSVRSLLDTMSYSNSNRYYSNSTVAYGDFEIAEVRAKVIYDTLVANASREKRDTFLLQGKLNEDYALQLFDIAKLDINTALTDVRNFKKLIPGITLIPKENNGVIGLNLTSTLSKVIIHYHTLETNGNVKDTLERAFLFDYSFATPNTAFTNIQNDRGATELATLLPHEGVDLSKRYLQSGAPVMTKIDLSNFYNFVDTAENILINQAEFIIEGVEDIDGLNPHSTLHFRIMDEEDEFPRKTGAMDTLLAGNYLTTEGLFYSVLHDSPSGQFSPATASYNSTNSEFNGYLTLFAQALYRKKTVGDAVNENRIQYLGILPLSPSIARSVNRTVFDKDKVKLRIHYTKPTNLTP
jgi:hypothetical protein